MGITMLTIKYHLGNLYYGKWFFGCKFYKGKPMLMLRYEWYDGPIYCLHVGPFWIEVI